MSSDLTPRFSFLFQPKLNPKVGCGWFATAIVSHHPHNQELSLAKELQVPRWVLKPIQTVCWFDMALFGTHLSDENAQERSHLMDMFVDKFHAIEEHMCLEASCVAKSQNIPKVCKIQVLVCTWTWSMFWSHSRDRNASFSPKMWTASIATGHGAIHVPFPGRHGGLLEISGAVQDEEGGRRCMVKKALFAQIFGSCPKFIVIGFQITKESFKII